MTTVFKDQTRKIEVRNGKFILEGEIGEIDCGEVEQGLHIAFSGFWKEWIIHGNEGGALLQGGGEFVPDAHAEGDE